LKKNLIVVIICFSLFHFKKVNGQDIHFTQFYASPLFLNPAFAGANVCSRVTMAYRDQWPGISKTYKTFLFSADHDFSRYNMGGGLLIVNDVAGSGNLSTTMIDPLISYGLRLTKKIGLRVGFQPGIGIKSINFNNLLFGDQIARGGNVSTLETPTQNKTYFDISTGALIYTENYWVGASFFHLNNTNESLFNNGESFLPVKISVHGGAKYDLNKHESDDFKKKSISPAFNYRHQQDFDQLDVGLYYTQYVFNFGLWYRGLPLLKHYAQGYANNDAISIIIGLQTKRFNMGYSYDLTVSRLVSLSNGAHEVTISYQLCKARKKKAKHGLMLPCPKF
jgi:type IX secretion system PorP/SprF family membrane protein